ncbi:major facilitator superfamily transporter [Pyricularia oryzae]|nr:major facilitator superfamily transporter [Pyricularia oryzae]KAI7929447.1 major facilitator superfamily transporter [Pyricularia oryzae]
MTRATRTECSLSKAAKPDNGGDGNALREGQSECEYPQGIRFALVISSFQTILATAIPTITGAFNSSQDIAWYSTGEQLAAASTQLPFGRAYTLTNTKGVFVTSIAVFLVGSAVCGFAPVSAVFIVGRLVQGVGMAGIFSGSFIVLARVTPLKTRSLFAGLFGAAYAIASVLGPLIGMCFTPVNLPVGVVIMSTIIWCLPNMPAPKSFSISNMTWKQTVIKFDPLGTVLLMASLICLMLALQSGGAQYSWSEPRLVAVLVIFAVTLVPWLVLQYFQGEEATVPLSMLCQRSVAGSNLFLLFLNGAFGVFIFYLPTWFQAILGDSAETSGFKQVALCLSTAVGAIAAGGLVAATGFYNPFLVLGSLLVTAGSAMCMMMQPDASLGYTIGAQILVGAGVGVGAEQANVAVQAVLPSDKVARGTSLTLFTRLLAMAISVPVAQNMMQQQIFADLGSSFAGEVWTDSGAADLHPKLRALFESEDSLGYRLVLADINYAISRCFMLAMILAAISVPFGLVVEWKNVKTDEEDAEPLLQE